MPGVQKPHWVAKPSRNASWIGCSPSTGVSPSIVSTRAPSIGLDRQQAGHHRPPVDQHGAGAAGALVAAAPGAGQALVAQRRRAGSRRAATSICRSAPLMVSSTTAFFIALTPRSARAARAPASPARRYQALAWASSNGSMSSTARRPASSAAARSSGRPVSAASADDARTAPAPTPPRAIRQARHAAVRDLDRRRHGDDRRRVQRLAAGLVEAERAVGGSAKPTGVTISPGPTPVRDQRLHRHGSRCRRRRRPSRPRRARPGRPRGRRRAASRRGCRRRSPCCGSSARRWRRSAGARNPSSGAASRSASVAAAPRRRPPVRDRHLPEAGVTQADQPRERIGPLVELRHDRRAAGDQTRPLAERGVRLGQRAWDRHRFQHGSSRGGLGCRP